MIILGIETSGPIGSLALRRDGRCLEERFLPELGRRHAQSLVPETMAFLDRHGLQAATIDAIAVSIGPGSFTGLRVGVTFAKTFAFAAGAKLTAVETFLAIASNTPSAGSVAVVADAQRRGVMLGEYVRGVDGQWRRHGEIVIVAPEEILLRVPHTSILTGPGLSRVTGLDQWPGEVAPPARRVPRASIIAEVGERQIGDEQLADAWTLEPKYVRKSAAEEKRDAAAGT